MLKLGDWNELAIVRFTDHGAYLDAGELGELLMPRAYVRPEMKPGHVVRVFVYLDQQERLVGTTETPLARVGDFACLRVAWTNRYGAFLDWGLMKDLFVPFSEQPQRMEPGRSYVVHVFEDPLTHRLVATGRVEKRLRPAPPADYRRGREVEALVYRRTPLGYKVVVDNAYAGLLYADAAQPAPRHGQRLHAYVTACRPDGKLDLSAQPLGRERVEGFAARLLDELERAGGELPFSDESSPEAIAERFGVSKKTFKQAVGQLYRQRSIVLDNGKICLVGQE